MTNPSEKILNIAGISEAKDYEVRTYSKGMRQRLGFAQSLVNDPDYLFLDEPLDGLDPIGRHDLKDSMLALKTEGRRIFLNTHILYDVEGICDEIGIIHEGKLLYAGQREGFLRRPSARRAVRGNGQRIRTKKIGSKNHRLARTTIA